jgi:hypothetical protein
VLPGELLQQYLLVCGLRKEVQVLDVPLGCARQLLHQQLHRQVVALE